MSTVCSGGKSSSSRGIAPVVEGPYYLTSQFLSPKRLTQLRQKEAKQRAKAAEIVELFKKTYCVPDHLNGGWTCIDIMLQHDERGRVIGLTVQQMARMLKKGVRL